MAEQEEILVEVLGKRVKPRKVEKDEQGNYIITLAKLP